MGRTRRSNGEGSPRRRADGRYEWRIVVGTLWNGKPDRRSVYGADAEACRRAADELKRRRDAGELGAREADREKVAGYLRLWLDARRTQLRPRTLEGYRDLIELHAIPALGTTKLQALRADRLDRLYAAKIDSGLSPRRVLHLHRCLHTALEQAVRWGYLTRNVADQASPPPVPETELRPPTSEEAGRLFAAAVAAEDRLQALWAVALLTGMRRGELLGLQWADIELDKGQLHVRRVLVRVKGRQPTYGEPKTKRSRRTVHLSPAAVGALSAHRDRQRFERQVVGEGYGLDRLGKPLDLVFATRLGGPLDGTVIWECWQRALKRAGLPAGVRFHDLRHAAATLMLDGGESYRTVAAVLGHSRPSTTANIYGHALDHRVRGATSAIERALALGGPRDTGDTFPASEAGP